MQPLDLLILALASWIVAYFLVVLDAPFDLMKRLREWFPLGGLLACIYCAAFWTAIAAYLLWQTDARPVVYVLAVWGLSMLLHRYTGGSHL